MMFESQKIRAACVVLIAATIAYFGVIIIISYDAEAWHKKLGSNRPVNVYAEDYQ